MRDKILQPLKDEVMKIQDLLSQPNELWKKMLEFKLVFMREDEQLVNSGVSQSVFHHSGLQSSTKKIEEQSFREFFSNMQQDLKYMPPVRVLFCGDDQKFNEFVQLYVEQVLLIQANLEEEDDEDEEDASTIRGTVLRRASSRQTMTSNLKRATQTKSKGFMSKGTPVNVDFRTFIIPPIP